MKDIFTTTAVGKSDMIGRSSSKLCEVKSRSGNGTSWEIVFDVYSCSGAKYRRKSNDFEVVSDTSSGAHPADGYQNGYWYVKID